MRTRNERDHTVKEYHAEQLDGTVCGTRNCAAATGADDVYYGTRGHQQLTAHQFRSRSGVSCIKGKDTTSGGLAIRHIIDTAAAFGVKVDFGEGVRRWTKTEVKTRLMLNYGGHFLGDYDQVPWPWRDHGSTFEGDHSAWAHDYREDVKDSHYDIVQPTVCWHDPLRDNPIRIPFSVLLDYNQKDGSVTKGRVGWVIIPTIPGGQFIAPDRSRTAFHDVALHDDQTKGPASVVEHIIGKGTLVELKMRTKGDYYKAPGKKVGSKWWYSPSMNGSLWIAEQRLDHVGGAT